MNRQLSFLVIALIAPMPALADIDPCAKAQTQMDLNACTDQAYRAADLALNQTYQTLRKRLSENGRTKLKDAQRAWISFRDAECTFIASGMEGGSAQPMVHSSCLTNLTRERTETLAKQMDCPEGDLACPR
ncbi:lysozyme inhibitor LprI family protein [Pseudomonas sp. Marseille-QA0892]